jgi:L-ribulose-5-phosphate 3-epimerase UlaE
MIYKYDNLSHNDTVAIEMMEKQKKSIIDKLKPCPFCGGRAYYHNYENTGNVICMNTECHAEIKVWHEGNTKKHYFETAKKAKRRWNKTSIIGRENDRI